MSGTQTRRLVTTGVILSCFPFILLLLYQENDVKGNLESSEYPGPVMRPASERKNSLYDNLQMVTTKKQQRVTRSVHVESSVYPETRRRLIDQCPEQNVDCKKFRELLRQWPSGKPKAAVYYLTQKDRLGYLIRSLRQLDQYFNDKFNYPVIVFHESDLLPVLHTKIRAATNSTVFFQHVEFAIPTFLLKPVESEIPCFSTIGYRHMCRFQSKLVYEQPILKGLDYFWRLDDDSFLLRPVNYDVFKLMREKNFSYGYIWRHLDATSCTEGLWAATREYINKNQIKTEFFDEWPQPYIYYNNFEISRADLWMSDQYAKFINYIDKKGGIYYHRWGDAPIKGIAVSMFVPRNKTHHFKDIGYQHTSYINLPERPDSTSSGKHRDLVARPRVT